MVEEARLSQEKATSHLYAACRHGDVDVVRRLLAVEGVQVRPLSATTKRAEGDRISAKCEGWTQYYEGSITGVQEEDETYDILFDDGECRSGVAARCIKIVRLDPLAAARESGHEEILRMLVEAGGE